MFSQLHIASALADFGDWWLDLPSLSGTILTANGWQSNQCSSANIVPTLLGHYLSNLLERLDNQYAGRRIASVVEKNAATTVPFLPT